MTLPSEAPTTSRELTRQPESVSQRSVDEHDHDPSQRLVPLLASVLVLVVVGGVTDLVLDRPATFWSVHVAFEVGIVLVSLTFAVILWRGWWTTARDLKRTREVLSATQRSLTERQAEQTEWQRQAEAERTGFGRAIDTQFTAWGLTPTEREIAFLLLQGHGHKQIAAQTGRGERTVRQHAVAVYQKSGIGGRSELAAFFLKDLLPSADSGRP